MVCLPHFFNLIIFLIINEKKNQGHTRSIIFNFFAGNLKGNFFPTYIDLQNFMIDEDDQVDVIYATIRYGVHVLDMMHQYI